MFEKNLSKNSVSSFHRTLAITMRPKVLQIGRSNRHLYAQKEAFVNGVSAKLFTLSYLDSNQV